MRSVNSIYFRITFGYIVLIFPFSILFSYLYFNTYKSFSPLKELTEIRNYPHQIIYDKYLNHLEDYNLILYAKITNNSNILKGFLSSKETFAPLSNLNAQNCFCHSKPSINSPKRGLANNPQQLSTIKNVELSLIEEKNCFAINEINKCIAKAKKRILYLDKPTYSINTLLDKNVFSYIKNKILKDSYASIPILYSINDLIISENIINSINLIQVKLATVTNTSLILSQYYDHEIKNNLLNQIDSLLDYFNSRKYEESQIYYHPSLNISSGITTFDEIIKELQKFRNHLLELSPDNKLNFATSSLYFYNFYKKISNNFQALIFNISKDLNYQFNEIYSQLTFYEHMFNNFLILSFIAMISGIFLSYIIVKPFLKSITNLHNSIEKVKQGDFNISFEQLGKDEISELKKAFMKMSHALKERENEILQRNKELAEMQASLIQSSKLSAIGMLATGIAHELNQPLMVINSYIDMLKEELKNDEKIIEDILILKKQIAKMKNIIIQLSDFSKTEDSPVYADINKIIENVLIFTETYFKKYKIVIDKDFDNTIPLIFIKQSQIEQVLLNILTNAVDAIKPIGNGKISIKTAYLNSEKIYISITDNGIGMQEEQLEKIFEPFYTTKKVGEGIGLGLYVSYKIINAHNGSIKATSKKGEGSCFSIILPIKSKMQQNN